MQRKITNNGPPRKPEINPLSNWPQFYTMQLWDEFELTSAKDVHRCEHARQKFYDKEQHNAVYNTRKFFISSLRRKDKSKLFCRRIK